MDSTQSPDTFKKLNVQLGESTKKMNILISDAAKAGATMEKEHLSIYAAMQEFEINDHKIIERWERIYLEEGPEGLAIERRGRSSKGRPPKQLPKQVEEDLLAEVQRLRAENDYLKNLQALVLEDERRQHKKRW